MPQNAAVPRQSCPRRLWNSVPLSIKIAIWNRRSYPPTALEWSLPTLRHASSREFANNKGRVNEEVMESTNIGNPDYFHKVVDCQWACPAHTPVPEYIRLIAEGRYSDAYMINWRSNVFPGILGRTCDRPCEPACRRGR